MKSKIIISGLLSLCLNAQASDYGRMWEGFANPQDSCRTKVWWFHGETETTRDGITADLEGFKRAGVGGVVYYDQVHGSGEGALEAFSPEWWRMFVFAAEEAKRLGLTFETHLSNGYCAGGPWITDELGMQMLVSTDTLLRGGEKFDGIVPVAMPQKKYHGFVGVLACRIPAGSGGKKRMKANTVAPAEGETVLVTDMGEEFTARSLTYDVSRRSRTKPRSMNVPLPVSDKPMSEKEREEASLMGFKYLPDFGELEVSDDGVTWRKVCALKPAYGGNTSWHLKTVSFPAAKGRYFRLRVHDWALPGEKSLKLGDFTLSRSAMVDDWQVKAAMVSDFVDTDDTPAFGADEVIRPEDIIDLTDMVDAGGHLSWKAPEGDDWLLLRFDHVPTGGRTKHGRKNLMGLEADKLSARAATVQWNNYFKVMLDTLNRHGLDIDGLHVDSHEAGAQNWTADFEKEFKALRHYDLRTMLPVMAGYVVGSPEKSVKTLRDVRRTVADLISMRHFATLDSLSRSAGVPFTAQAVGNGLCITGDPIQAKGRVSVPQGEFWNHHPDGGFDIKESSSAAHIYGKPKASGEAFTDVHFDTPMSYIKTLADNAYCYGLNEFVVCASAYQPYSADSISTGGGRHYCLNRHNVYWDYSRPFWDYQARCAYLLRQGKPVVDFCLYLGDDAPVKIRSSRLPELPAGTDFDAFTSDALFNRLSVSGGRIVCPSGMSYQAMVIPSHVVMTDEASRRVAEMERQGAVIIRGDKASIAVPDMAMSNHDMRRQNVWYNHRTTADTDIYFISNHGTADVADDFMFRSGRRNAEWWNPVDGTRHKLDVEMSPDGRATVRLRLAAKEAGFVILTDEAGEGVAERCETADGKTMVIGGPWTVYFDPKSGGPGGVRMPKLYDWTQSPDKGVKYYSGTVIYDTAFDISEQSSGKTVTLSLGGLHEAARVWINGKEAVTVWCAPFEVDVTPYIHSGKNTLRLEVVNTWHNRMVLDSQLPAGERVVNAFPLVVTPQSELKPSGITGPVRLTFKKCI